MPTSGGKAKLMGWVGLLLVVLLSGSPIAVADSEAIRDANDTPGQLDIRAITHRHNEERLVHEIVTFDAWRSRVLSSDRDWLAFEFSTDRSDGWERLVWIRHSERRGIFGKLYGLGEQRAPVFIRRVRAWRSDVNAVAIAMTLDDLAASRGDNYRWLASSSFQTRRGPCRSTGTSYDDAFPPQGTCWDVTREIQHDANP